MDLERGISVRVGFFSSLFSLSGEVFLDALELPVLPDRLPEHTGEWKLLRECDVLWLGWGDLLLSFFVG